MEDTRFTTDHLVELRQIEKARMRRGQPGLGQELAALIARLTSGGVGSNAATVRTSGGATVLDPRRAQAKLFWDKGWGRELGFMRFRDYLAMIPKIPTFPDGYDARFPHLVLVDQRITLTKACQLLDVTFDGNDQTFVPHDPAQTVTAPLYWMRCQDGRIHRNRKPTDCRAEFAAKGDEVGLSAFEGLSLYAQHPDFLELSTAIDLPSSVHASSRVDCARLRQWYDGYVQLRWSWDGGAHPSYGSASRGIADFNPRA